MIKAAVLKDSVSSNGARITTFVLTYPRFIHAEFMTHRMISRNASSSRAIPTSKMMKSIIDNPAMPIAFTKNCKGMQANEVISDQTQAQDLWKYARDQMVKIVENLTNLGVHKQHANRLLEPFQYITVVATATDWSNFFALRCHKDAQPEFQALATLMWETLEDSSPQQLEYGEWHLPFVDKEDLVKLRTLKAFKEFQSDYHKELAILIKQSVARCARVSYNTHDGTDSSVEKDTELYNRLVGSAPIHASPTEHQAMALNDKTHQSGNFKGWLQYRKTLENENIETYNGPVES